MRCIVYLLCLTVLGGAAPTVAQTLPQRTPAEVRTLIDAHRSDFDYLLGDWEIMTVSKDYGPGRGFWSAVRLADGGHILDEYRLVGDSGQTYYVSATMRSYNAVLDRWELISAHGGNGLLDFGTAQKKGSEMHIVQSFGVMTPTPAIWRIRYYDIRSDRFSWTADRSTDEGQTWEREVLTIEARRIGPARVLPPLTPWRSRQPN